MTLRLGLNHNSMVSLQDDPIWFSEGKICNQKVATLNRLPIHKVPVPNPIKDSVFKTKSFSDS